MALFGLFGKKSDDGSLRKLAQRASAKRAQAVDRWEAIQSLSRMGTEEAVRALLPRFTFYVEPSITDQEEKDAAFSGIVGAGDNALGPVSEFLMRADSISWPVKILDALVSSEVVVSKLIDLLQTMDTEYERDPQRKIQILALFEERIDARIAEAVHRFLEDANETVRFHTVGALLAQDEVTQYQEPLIDCLCEEESVRVRNRILQGFSDRKWSVAERKEGVLNNLPSGFVLDAGGVPHGKR